MKEQQLNWKYVGGSSWLGGKKYCRLYEAILNGKKVVRESKPTGSKYFVDGKEVELKILLK